MGWIPSQDFVRYRVVLFLFMMAFMMASPGAASNLSGCHTDLSACRDYFPGSALDLLPTCCRQLMRAVQQSEAECSCYSLTIAASKDQSVSVALDCGLKRDAVDHCYDDSRMTTSPTESLDGKSAMSKRSLSEFCVGCKEGDYNVNAAKPPPAKHTPANLFVACAIITAMLWLY